MSNVPDKPSLEGLEKKWAAAWQTDDTYAFDATKTRDEVFSIDTPPPTVSGSLHVGHIFSYTHTDTIARYQRMTGKVGLLPDGLGRQRPARPSVVSRTTSASAATRRSPTTPTSSHRPVRRWARTARRSSSRSRSADRTSSSCAASWSTSTRRPSRTSGARSDCPSTGRCSTRRSTSARGGPASAPSSATSRAARPTSRRRRACGTSPSRPPSPRPSWRTGSARAPTTS